MSTLLSVPRDVITCEILTWLTDAKDLNSVGQTCRLLRAASNQNELWKGVEINSAMNIDKLYADVEKSPSQLSCRWKSMVMQFTRRKKYFAGGKTVAVLMADGQLLHSSLESSHNNIFVSVDFAWPRKLSDDAVWYDSANNTALWVTAAGGLWGIGDNSVSQLLVEHRGTGVGCGDEKSIFFEPVKISLGDKYLPYGGGDIAAMVPLPTDFRISKVATSDGCVVALGDNGLAVAWGTNLYGHWTNCHCGGRVRAIFDELVGDICCSDYTIFGVSLDRNTVYVVGEDEHYEQAGFYECPEGYGDGAPFLSPFSVTNGKSVVVSLVAGPESAYCLYSDGTVYSNEMERVKYVDAFIVKIACGNKHLVALANDGRCFICQNGNSVRLLTTSKVVEMACTDSGVVVNTTQEESGEEFFLLEHQ